MADTQKILGQSAPLAATPTPLYTGIEYSIAVVDTLLVCNRSAVATSFRVAVVPRGEVLADRHYVYYDHAIAGLSTFLSAVNLVLAHEDTLVVYAADATLSMSAFGRKIT